MQRIPRSLRAAFAGALLITLAAVPVHAADPAKALLPGRPSATVSTTAKILIATNVFAQPGKHIKLRLPTHAQWGGGPHVLLVLDSRMYKGKAWLRVALPTRPNGSSGWIREDFVRLSKTQWRVTVNREAHTVTVYRDGRKQRSFMAVIGTSATPTPRGLYAIYEKLPQPDPKGFLGPLGAASDRLLRCALQLRRRPRARRDPRTRRHEPGRPARLVGVARVRAGRRRQHRLDGPRHPARHARPDRLIRHPNG